AVAEFRRARSRRTTGNPADAGTPQGRNGAGGNDRQRIGATAPILAVVRSIQGGAVIVVHRERPYSAAIAARGEDRDLAIRRRAQERQRAAVGYALGLSRRSVRDLENIIIDRG